jgi:hypothetical protein
VVKYAEWDFVMCSGKRYKSGRRIRVAGRAVGSFPALARCSDDPQLEFSGSRSSFDGGKAG